MPRYFLELSYKGINYSGFQIQKNANTIQAEAEKALSILYQTKFSLSASSRTDAGVHALQNFFHFDSDIEIEKKILYNLNALLPGDIAAKNIYRVSDKAHCRFDAILRAYKYYICQTKNPFLKDRAYYYPYPINIDFLTQLADTVCGYTDFTSFSKKRTAVKTFQCSIKSSKWYWENECLIYSVEANRFLRGMVRALTGTMLRTAKAKESIHSFKKIVESLDCKKADFSPPAHGLFLTNIIFKEGILNFNST